MIHTVSHFWI